MFVAVWIAVSLFVSGHASAAEPSPSELANAAATLTTEEKIRVVQAMSEENLRGVTLEQADMLEELSKTRAFGDDPEDEEEARALAEAIREKAEKPGFKKWILRSLKKGGKALLLGVHYTSYSAYEILVTPIAAVVGFARGIMTGENAAQFMTSPNEDFFGPRLFMGTKTGQFGGTVLLFGEGMVLGAANPVGWAAAAGSISARKIYQRCIEDVDPEKPRRKKDRLCSNAALIDKMTVRAVGGATVFLGSGIHNGVAFGFRKIFRRGSQTPSEVESGPDEEPLVEIPIIP